MDKRIQNLLQFFSVSSTGEQVPFQKYTQFSDIWDFPFSGKGPVGDSGFLVLWEKNALEKRNDDYMVSTFLDDVFLIGSDGGENAFGVNREKQFVVVPFVGMCNENVKILADSFDGFLLRVANCDY